MALQQPIKKRNFNRYVLLTIIAFITIAILLLTGSVQEGDGGGEPLPNSEYHNAHRVITTEDVVNGRFYARGANCSWTPDGKKLSWLSGSSGDLVTLEVVGEKGDGYMGKKRVVVRSNQFVARPWKVRFSGDGGLLLVGFEPRRLFRSTILARYAVHSATTGQLLHHLSTTSASSSSSSTPTASSSSSSSQQLLEGGEEGEERSEHDTFQLATWSNDNRTIMLVHKNDLYAVQLNGGINKRVMRITSDGSENVFNGVADWVYEEELFTSSSTSVYPSPTGLHISYLKFNDTRVTPSNYNLYGDYSSEPYFDDYFQYPKFGTVRYPKSGTPNPTVSVHIVKLGDSSCWSAAEDQITSSSCTWEFKLDSMMEELVSLKERYAYLLGSFKWIDSSDDKFAMNIFNRIQNTSWIVECSVSSRNCELVRSLTQANGWIDSVPIHKHNGEYFTLASVDHEGFEFGSVVSLTSDLQRVVTRGGFTVDEIVGVMGGNYLVFKSGLIENSVVVDPSQAHYYVIDLSSSTEPTCLTCYNNCTFNSGKFSLTSGYFVNTCERESGVSNVDLVRISVQNGSVTTSVQFKLEENLALAKKLEGVLLPEVSFFSIPYELNGRNYSLRCKVIGPRGWKSAPKHSLPLVIDIYGGPNSQKVTRKFTPNDWSYSLASNQLNPTVYLIVDGVGSGRQSNSLAFEIYRDLGDKEIFDKIFAVEWVLEKFGSLDPGRTLIWGWSYGGYVAGMVMGRDEKRVVKCGVSVAPVVNWFYYDTIYTERYMSTPEDNPTGYNTSNILRYLNNFKGKDYLLVHGNADDNVHYQQSMVLARGLEQKAILFRMQSYPDENHSLGSVRPHLFATLEDFVFNQCFAKRAHHIKK